MVASQPVPATAMTIVGLALNASKLRYRACSRVLIVALETSQQSLLFIFITCESTLDQCVSCGVKIYTWFFVSFRRIKEENRGSRLGKKE